MAFACGKRDSKKRIKKLYRKFLKKVDRILMRLIGQYGECLPKWNALEMPPSRKRLLESVVDGIAEDITAAIRVYQYATDRVFADINLPAPEKILSLSDRCASFIQKGDREPVIGYKPQVLRTAAGFISGYELNEGNTQDSTRLLPMMESHIQNTGTMPMLLTADDGCSSGKVRKELLGMGVTVVSITGSKGKKITSEEEWESEDYQRASWDRSGEG